MRLSAKCKKYLDPYFPLESPVIPFVIAKLALDTDSGIHHVFAMDTLFELLGDPVLARKLYDRFRFTYKDFIKISGEYDLFRLNEVTRLYQEMTPLQGEIARLRQEMTALQGEVGRLQQELARLRLGYLISRLLRKIMRRA
jgi:hypothetical protein